MLTRGIDKPLEETKKDVVARDKIDMERSVDPLHVIDEDWVLDTTPMTLDQVVETIITKVRTIYKGA